MQVDITPERIQATAGVDTMIVVQVRNTSEVICAYDVRVLGLDPRWVRIDGGRLSLFPDAAGTATVHVSLPEALPAGTRRLGIEVTSDVDARSRLGEVEVVVPTVEKATISVDPMSVTAGRTASVGVTVGNEGNRVLDAPLRASDPEAKVGFEFDPPLLDVAPGDRDTVQARATARRPIFGQPKVRVLTFSVPVGEPPPQATVTFIQRPIVSRGLLGLLGLLAAVSVFAFVLTVSLSRVVDVSKVDEELLLRAIEGPDVRGGPANPATITGTVTSLTTGLPADGVTVEVFPSDSAEQSFATDSTDPDGTYSLGDLEAGTYKVRFRGAGFTPLWYPSALDFSDGGEVEVEAGESKPGIDARMGGVPGVIAGRVIGDDPSGATLELLVPAAAIDAPTDAVVKSAAVDATGAFRLESVPSPGSYILQLSKTGFSKTRQAVRLEAGQTVEGIEILLRRGDGSIAGRVFGPDGPLGGVTVTATDGANTVATVSLTEGDVGAFFLRSITTPGSFTVTFAKSGFATETLSLNLSPAQELGGISATLSKGDGSISGTVAVVGIGPAGGVSVNVTNGQDTFDTVTLTEGAVGTWLVTGLPIPSTYTVTFSGPGLANQTRSVDVDPLAGGNVTGVDATLSRANGSIAGTVSVKDTVDDPTPTP
ncbi:MAG: carboxypeptidase regulatory-like domain-containing protein, partial [Acidimicrobiales bacterium]